MFILWYLVLIVYNSGGRPAGSGLQGFICSCARGMVINVYIRCGMCLCGNLLDLAHKCFSNHVARFVANWSVDDSCCVGNWVVMGKTNMGHLLGLGCKTDNRTHIALHIFGAHSSWENGGR